VNLLEFLYHRIILQHRTISAIFFGSLAAVLILIIVWIGLAPKIGLPPLNRSTRPLAPSCSYVSERSDFAFADICLEVSDFPALKKEIGVKVSIVPKIDLEKAETWYELSPGIEYVSGDLPWTGSYKENKPVELSFNVRFTENGNQQLVVIATGAVGDLEFYIKNYYGKVGHEPPGAHYDLVIPNFDKRWGRQKVRSDLILACCNREF
jgi:hypothetical protein